MPLNCGVGEDSWEFLELQGDTNQSWRKSVLNIHWKDWCWSWSSSTLATWCEELTQRKRPWCWERLKAGGKGDDRGWHGWMASSTQWTWVWASLGDGKGQGSLCAAVHGATKSQTRLSDWTATREHRTVRWCTAEVGRGEQCSRKVYLKFQLCLSLQT